MSTPIRTIIVEDEAGSRRMLKEMLEEVKADVQILGEAERVATAVELIETQKPELVFMDIHLLDGSGFEVIDQTDFSSYEVIFITAYQQHAIRAFDLAAIHYLMKPITAESLAEAIERYRETRSELSFRQRLPVMRNSLNNENGKIILPLSNGLTILRIDEIVRCESSNNYTTFYLENGTELLVSRPLLFYDELLTGHHFSRIHARHLVNLKYVSRYTKGQGGYITLSNGHVVDVSRGRRSAFLDDLNAYACGN